MQRNEDKTIEYRNEGGGGSSTEERRGISRRSYLQIAGVAGFGVGGTTAGAFTSETARAGSTATIVDDFEDGDLSEYAFDRGSSGASIVSSPAYNGNYALEISGTQTELISTSGLPTYPTSGDRFSYRVRATGGADDVNLTYGVQDHNNRYFVRVDFANDDLFLFRYEAGTSYQLAEDATVSLAEDTWYEVEVDWTREGGHTATVLDESGSRVAQVTASDSTWTSGGIGYDAYLGSGGTVYFDYVTVVEDGASTNEAVGVLDDFEDGDLSEYTFDRGSSGASVVSSPTFSGGKALEISATDTEMISTAGLDRYPERGDVFSYWVKGTNGADRINLTYGVQDHDNRYFVRVNVAQGHLGLYRYEGATAYKLAGKSVSVSENAWYEVVVEWTKDDEHVITLYDGNHSRRARISASDATWTSGGIGYDAYLADDGGTVYLDYVTLAKSGSGSRFDHNRAHVDTFEDGDLSEYTFDRGSSGASIVSSPTFRGSNALEIAGTNTEMISTSGLKYYPSAGETFSCWVRGSGGAGKANVSYGVQDHDNRYFVRVNLTRGYFALYRYENASSYKLAGTSVSLSQDTWYEAEVEWNHDGTHVATLSNEQGDQLARISATDATWTSGGIGYDAYLGSGESMYFDFVTLEGFPDSGRGAIVDDFEDGDLSEYAFDRGSSGASIVSSPTFRGSNALEIAGTNTEMISTSGLGQYPSAGDTFRYRVRATGGADDVNLTYGVQDHNNRYFVRIDFANDNLRLYRYEAGTSYKLAEQTSGFTLSEDAWYKVKVTWEDGGGHTATLYDEGNEKLAQISGSDSTWTSGGIGYDAYLGSGGTVYFDFVTLGDYRDSGNVVDDFEDGDLSEYAFDRGSSGASVVSGPAYSGDNALEISGTDTEMISTSGLPQYPSAGDVFNYWVRATDGADDVNLTYGVQDHTNRYFVRVDFANDNLRLYRYEAGTSYKLAEQTSGFTLSEDAWYGVEVRWKKNGQHVVTLYAGDGPEIAHVTASDAMWTSGGIGYDAYLADDGGTVYLDYVTMVDYEERTEDGEIDYFEDGDLSEYAFDRGSSGASIVSSPTYDGSHALEIAGTTTEMISTSGLNSYPAAGERFSYWVRATGGADDVNLTYGVQDHNNRYFVRVDFANDDLFLFRYEGGTSYKLAEDATVSLAEDTWYEIEVDWQSDGTHTATVYTADRSKVARVSATDTTWTSGGIGYDAYLGSGGTAYFDYVGKNHPRVHDRGKYDNASVGTLAVENGVKHPTQDRIAFVTAAFGNGHELCIADGVTSIDDVPKNIYRVTDASKSYVSVDDWLTGDILRYHTDHTYLTQEVPPSGRVFGPVTRVKDTLRGGDGR